VCGHPARLRAFSCITAFCYPYPYATTPHARALFRIHYEGCQVWSGLCWGHFGGGYTPRDGASKWGSAPTSSFRIATATDSGLWIFLKYAYGHVRATLSSHVRAAARPRHVRPDDTTTHTPLHSPLHSAFQHRISAGLRSPDEYDAPENKTRRHSFISNGFTSRAEMPPNGKSVHRNAKK
jgi:hypothetical protein